MIRHVFRKAAVLRCPLIRAYRASPGVRQLHLRDGFISGQQAPRATLRLPHLNQTRSFSSIGFNSDDTIYALSSGQGKAGIAVIRISGPACLDVYHALCPAKPPPEPRYATVRTLHHPSQPDDILDSSALILHFPGSKTVTGDNILELHVHGGPATVKAVLAAIPLCAPQIRYAEPGEFTRRAFLASRLDLAQVESLSDALAAETEQQRRAAVRGSSGALGKAYDAWRTQLLHARAEIEALIDFSEDQHFDESPAELLGNVRSLVDGILKAIARHEEAGRRGELVRGGIRIALVGPPNVGKSSLMNLVVGREASIVSQEAGTTRDVVEASLDVRGYLCTFADTAGFRSTSAPNGSETSPIGAVEEEGIRRARRKALDSDIVVALASVERDPASGRNHIHYDADSLSLAAGAAHRLLVVNKCDATTSTSELEELLHKFAADALSKFAALEGAVPLTISCRASHNETVGAEAGGLGARTGGSAHPAQGARYAARGATTPAGLAAAEVRRRVGAEGVGDVRTVVEELVRSFERMTSLPADMQDLLGVTARQRQLLAQCREHLEDFMAEASRSCAESEGGGGDGDAGVTGGLGWAAGAEPDIVLAAEHLRYAANCLSRITGRGEAGDVEEVLGVIFEKFCVGK